MGTVDYIILIIYFTFVIGIGFVLKKFTKSSEDFFSSGRSLPAWICGLAFISANLGAQEVIGMGASGAKYGIMTSHFYWVGAIPAMVFIGIFMMPFYYGSKARSVPEYLKLRFDEKTRGLNAITFAIMTVFSSGISMYALAKLLELLLHKPESRFLIMGADFSMWSFNFSLIASAIIVLAYITLGGLTSAIYNEVLQFFLIVLGFIPLAFLGLKDVGWWPGLKQKLEVVALAQTSPISHQPYGSGAFYHSWAYMDQAAKNPLGLNWFVIVFGLGFVLSFGYWCTDFLVVQRAMAARDMSAARRTPLIAAIPKMLFPALVILPGMVAVALTYAGSHAGSSFSLPPKGNSYDYDLATPLMLAHYFPQGLLGLGLTALMASFMSGMAGNVTAFNTVWTYDIYQSYIAPNRSDRHYLTVGRVTTVVGIIISLLTAFVANKFNNIMDVLQLVFGFVNAPLLATFLLGMFWKRTTGHGAFYGLLAGTLGAFIHHAVTITAGNDPGFITGGFFGVVHTYPVDMARAFTAALWAFGACFLFTVVISVLTPRTKSDQDLVGLVYSLTPKIKESHLPWYKQPAALGIIVLLAAIILNIIFW
ncbi:MAG: sodium:solute symporter family protein [Phycisphaerae bacterium]